MQDKQSVWSNPWIQLALGVICMMTVANLQYGWTSFTSPLGSKFNWHSTAIGVSYGIFILLQTWLAPINGWLIDRFGSGLVVAIGGALAGTNWIMNANADSLQMLYLGAVIGGVGAGCVYIGCIANALKWFSNYRGFAVGLTAGSYGAGAATTVGPIKEMIKTSGFEQAFLVFGISMVLVVVCGLFMVRPPADILARTSSLHGVTRYNARPMEVLREPAFWILYLLFVLGLTAALMAGAQYVSIARSGGFLNETAMVLMFALPWTFSEVRSVFGANLLNGGGRPLFGWLSDKMGREAVLGIVFGILTVAMVLIPFVKKDPGTYLTMVLTIYLCGGVVFAILPSTCTDSFGTKHAATNYGILYTAKGVSSLIVPFGPMVIAAFDTSTALFVMTAVMTAICALISVFVLKPMRLDLQRKYDALYAAGKGQ